MRGHASGQTNLFVKINLEELVPADHPQRAIKRMADEALAAMSRTFAAAYAPAEKGGRPSIPPERRVACLRAKMPRGGWPASAANSKLDPGATLPALGKREWACGYAACRRTPRYASSKPEA